MCYLLILSAALPMMAAASESQTQEALAALQGRWVPEVADIDGRHVNPDPTLEHRIEGTKMIVVGMGRNLSTKTIELDLTKSPAWFDLVTPRGSRSRGIYRLEGDRLTLCYTALPDQPRPTVFESVPGRRQYFQTYRRSPVDGPRQDEGSRHQGTWSVLSQVRDGQEAHADVVASIRRVVEGDHVTWTRDGKSFAGTKVTYDPSQTPHALDLIPDGGPNRDKHVLGIYKLEGDELTICVADVGEPRPTAFEAAAGSKRTLQKFRRIAAAGKGEDLKLLDRARLQGEWNLVECIWNGRNVGVREPVKWVITSDRMIGNSQGIRTPVLDIAFEIDPTQSPPAIDMTYPIASAKGQRVHGIYNLEGDRLTICYGPTENPRPVAFESRPRTRHQLYVYLRVKP